VRILISFFLSTLFVQLGNCAAETTQDCPVKQHPETMKRSYTGRYVNPAEGFDVLIPRGLVGRDFDEPSYQRGFVILFQDQEESLVVDGEHNSLYWKNAREAADFDSSSYRDDGRKIVFSKGDILLLDRRRAYSVTTSYTCPGSGIQYSSITALALGVDREYVYTLRWEGKSDELENGRKIMPSLYSTWHFRKPTG
jgi:hypothetical protein